jgi:hypothetical protein
MGWCGSTIHSLVFNYYNVHTFSTCTYVCSALLLLLESLSPTSICSYLPNLWSNKRLAHLSPHIAGIPLLSFGISLLLLEYFY